MKSPTMLVRSQPLAFGDNTGEFARQRDRYVGTPDPSPSLDLDSQSDGLHESLSDLYAHQARWLFASPRKRIELLERCITMVAQSAREWVDVACEIKQIPAGNPCRAEELLAGPVITLRYLRLLLRNLKALDNGQPNPLPGRLFQAADGRWQVPVLPIARELFDPFCFVNFHAHVRLTAGLSEEDAIAATRPAESRLPTTSLVLGAGNVTGILSADVLGKVFQEHHAVLLKLHPLTDPLRPIFEHAFSPLIEAGCLRIVSGDAAFGARAIQHDMVDAVHITGSVAAHEAIVWGTDADARKRSGKPLLDKPVTSELGNVTPWIVVPGHYSTMQLQAQAENIAASIVNNAGFNCLATRVLVTWKHWPQREDLLSRLQAIFSRLPRRVAYYPGAQDRYERFTGCRLDRGELNPHATGIYHNLPQLPWTLLRDVNPADSPLFCREESFVPVCAEMPLEAADEFSFLGRATDFVNDELWGTLCATLTVPSVFRRTSRGQSELQAAINRLRYGTVTINQWSGIAFAMLTLPWGGHPSSTIFNPQSGLGWVHNTFGLQAIEKTILEGPLVVVPKPIWTPGHRHAESIAWSLFNLYHRPSLRHVGELAYAAFMASFK